MARRSIDEDFELARTGSRHLPVWMRANRETIALNLSTDGGDFTLTMEVIRKRRVLNKRKRPPTQKEVESLWAIVSAEPVLPNDQIVPGVRKIVSQTSAVRRPALVRGVATETREPTPSSPSPSLSIEEDGVPSEQRSLALLKSRLPKVPEIIRRKTEKGTIK